MNSIQALQQRKSVRAFLPKEVEPDKIESLLTAASQAPSGANTQPWQVAVVSGHTKQILQEKLIKCFQEGDRGKADYQYYPKEWETPYKQRRINCGQQLYDSLEIGRHDKQRRLDQWAANYRAFDAPVMLLFFLDEIMEDGSFLDYGMFLQSLMLAAVELGLATCPQASYADYATVIKTSLGYPKETLLLCGIALGYEDPEAAINTYRTPRDPVDSFTRYFK